MPLIEEQRRQALGASLLWLALLASVWLLAYLGRVADWLRHLLPEQLVVMALVGALVFGVSLVAGLLLLLGVGVRLILFTMAVQRWWQRAPQVAPATPAG